MSSALDKKVPFKPGDKVKVIKLPEHYNGMSRDDQERFDKALGQVFELRGNEWMGLQNDPPGMLEVIVGEYDYLYFFYHEVEKV